MTTLSDRNWPVTDPVSDKPFFVCDPAGDTEFFATQAERDKAAEGVVDSYLDEFWDEEVTNVFVGFVTGVSQEFNRKDRPDDLDEDGLDENGDCWHPDWEFKCDYKVQPLKGDKHPSPSELLAQAAELLKSASSGLQGGGYQDLVVLRDVLETEMKLRVLSGKADPSSTQQS